MGEARIGEVRALDGDVRAGLMLRAHRHGKELVIVRPLLGREGRVVPAVWYVWNRQPTPRRKTVQHGTRGVREG
jgi:hypothetical protein